MRRTDIHTSNLKSWLCVLACLVLLIGGIIYYNKNLKNTPAPCLFLAWGFSLDGFPISTQRLEQLEQETKITAQLIQFYFQWPASPEDHFESMRSSLEAITNVGAIPCLTWEPMALLNNEEKIISYSSILNGSYDAYIKAIAQELKRWDKPLIIRFAQEMNLKRYHWGTEERQYGFQSPEIYVKLFRYIVEQFDQQQVKNVLWAFCPNVDADPNESWNQVKHYYPGDQYVDILGMDGYNWAYSQQMVDEGKASWIKPWLSFEELFSPLYHTLKAIAPHKPIIVFETATTNRKEQKKKLWIKEALQTAQKWKLSGIIWFQAQKEEDWRIQQGEDYSYVSAIRSALSPLHEWMNREIKSRSDIK